MPLFMVKVLTLPIGRERKGTERRYVVAAKDASDARWQLNQSAYGSYAIRSGDVVNIVEVGEGAVALPPARV